MAKSNRNKYILGGIILLAIVYVGVINPGILETGNQGGNTNPFIPPTQVQQTPPPTGTTLYEGPITLRHVSSDKLDPGTEYGEDTELDVLIYRLNSDGSFNKIATPTSAAPGVSTVTASPGLKTVYAEYSIASGQDYYVDASSVPQLNDRSAGAYQWLDLNNDGRPTYVFPIDITGFVANPAIQPQFDFIVELVDEGTFTLDSPLAVDVTDTGKQRCNIKWSGDMTASGDGIAITRIRMTFNSTETAEWDPLQSNISFPTGSDPNSAKEKIFLSQFTPTELASSFRYDYVLGNGDISDARLLLSPLNGETEFEMPVELWVNMDTVGTALNATLAIQYIDAHGNYAETSDNADCN